MKTLSEALIELQENIAKAKRSIIITIAISIFGIGFILGLLLGVLAT